MTVKEVLQIIQKGMKEKAFNKNDELDFISIDPKKSNRVIYGKKKNGKVIIKSTT